MVHALAEIETVVVDDPDVPQDIDNEDHMNRQVYVLGVWHRNKPDRFETACGVAYHTQFCPSRIYVLDASDGDLCETCFTPDERFDALTTARKKGTRR